MKYCATFIAVLLCFAYSSMNAQRAVEPGDQIELITKDGNKFIGTVIKFTGEDITIQTESIGEVSIFRDQIASYSKEGEDNLTSKNKIQTLL